MKSLRRIKLVRNYNTVAFSDIDLYPPVPLRGCLFFILVVSASQIQNGRPCMRFMENPRIRVLQRIAFPPHLLSSLTLNMIAVIS